MKDESSLVYFKGGGSKMITVLFRLRGGGWKMITVLARLRLKGER